MSTGDHQPTPGAGQVRDDALYRRLSVLLGEDHPAGDSGLSPPLGPGPQVQRADLSLRVAVDDRLPDA